MRQVSRLACLTSANERWFTIPCSGKTASFASNVEKESGGEADPLCSSIDVFDEQHIIPFLNAGEPHPTLLPY